MSTKKSLHGKKGLLARKSIHGHFEGLEEGGEHLKKHLGPIQLIAIGIGAIIGAGIFVITGPAAAIYAGPAITLSFVVAAIVCVFAGLCYAELSSMIPASGGAYAYAYVAMGEFAAWLVGWMISAQYILSSSTVAVGWSGYVVSFLGDFGITFPDAFTASPFKYIPGTGWVLTGALFNFPAVLLILALGGMIAIGIRAVALFNHIMVVIKLSTIILFVLIGFAFIHPENWIPFIPENTGTFGEFGWSGILRGAGIVFFAYLGFDTVSTLSQDAKNPHRDIPIGVLGSLGISAVAYLITSIVLTGVVSYTLLNVPDPMSVALHAMGSKLLGFKIVVKLAILAGLSSAVLAVLLGLTRVLFAISRDGLLPKQFGQLHPKTKTPLFNALVITLVAVLLAGLFPVNALAELVSMIMLVMFVIVCLGVLILRKTAKDHKRSFRVPFSPYLPLLGIVVSLGQMIFVPLTTWIELFCWIVIGGIVYFRYGIRHSKLRAL